MTKSNKVAHNSDVLHYLTHCKPKQRQAILNCADSDLIACIQEIALNTLNGNIPLTSSQKTKLKKKKSALRSIAYSKGKQKKKVVQQGGIVGALLGAVVPSVLQGLMGKIL